MKRRGFTLVELLVTITIIAILASMVLFALSSALESAKRDKTLATISKLNSLVMAKYESYRTRRLPIQITNIGTYTTWDFAKYRVDAIRDFMRMEMPERFSDIDDPPITKTIIGGTQTVPPPVLQVTYENSLPPLTQRNPGSDISDSAKCLYLLVSKGLGDPDVMSQFSDDEIAIDETDKMRYFVDGWGNQILFFRWAPGFASPLQQDVATATQHDPFDPMGVYKTASDPSSTHLSYDPKFPTGNKPPLFPLIYSSAENDRIITPGHSVNPTEIEAHPVLRYGDPQVNNDPYYTIEKPPAVGSWVDTNMNGVDDRGQDITNQDLSQTQ